MCFGEIFQNTNSPCHKSAGVMRYQPYIRSSLYWRVKNIFFPDESIESYLRKVFSYCSHTAAGFKLMLNQILQYPYLNSYLKRNNFKVIQVRRKNILKIYISRIRSNETGVFHAIEAQKQIKIRMPIPHLIQGLEGIKDEIDRLKQNVVDINREYCLLTYENLIENRDEELFRILSFLDVNPDISLQCESKKITSEDLSQVVLNYDEVSNVLKNTPYEQYLSPTI